MTNREHNSFRFAERCLYEYPKNLERLERLRAELKDLSSRTVQNYEAGDHSAPGDPVFRYVERAEELEEEIARLVRWTEPITKLILDFGTVRWLLEGTANELLPQVMRLWYFEKVPKGEIAEKINVDRRTVYKMRERLVKLVIKYLEL